jgi:hypothetical protein
MAAIQWWLFINKSSSSVKYLERTGSECSLCLQVFLLSWFVPHVLMSQAVTLFLYVKLLQLPLHSAGKVITHKFPLSVSVPLGMKQSGYDFPPNYP